MKVYIMIALLFSVTYLAGNEIGREKQRIVTAKYKQLQARYQIVKNKKIAWRHRRKELVGKFKELYDEPESLGENNLYGKLRLERRKKEFYTSLKEQDSAINAQLFSLKKALKKEAKKASYVSKYERPVLF